MNMALPQGHRRQVAGGWLRRIADVLWGGNRPLPRQQERRLAVVMSVLTLVYLIVEMGFNARLLDVVGGLASHQQVADIERWGRTIAAVAVGLLTLNWLLQKSLRRGWTRRYTAVCALLVIGTCMLATYFAQRQLVESLVARSDGQARARAALAVPMAYLMAHRDFSLKGLDLDADDLKRPEGKTLLATLPLLVLAVDRLEQRIARQGQGFFELFADTVRGGSATSYEGYRQSLRQLDDNHRRYMEGSRSYLEAISNEAIGKRQTQAWSDYRQNLKQRNRRLTPDNVPRRHWPQVRRTLQGQGIPVHERWRPNDRAGFNDAINRQVRQQARNRYAGALQQHLDAGWVDPGLDRQRFLALPAIQEKWRTALQLPSAIVLHPDLSEAQYLATVYNPALALDAQTLIEQRLADPSRYSERNDLAQVGRDSYRALIVPMIALLFSLMGAFTHLFKCFSYLAKLCRPLPVGLHLGAFALYSLVVLALPMTLGNKVTAQPLLVKLREQSASILGPMGWLAVQGVQWTAQVQPWIYPLNEGVRVHVLQRLDYGYADKE